MGKLVCWSCGASLQDIPLPFTRLEQCKNCRADLHVCRLCRYYNPNVFDKCDHDMAEPARDATVANFCHYFRPRPGAFQPDKKTKSDEALAQLKSLFGEEIGESPATDDNDDHSLTEIEKAKKKLEALLKEKK